MAVFNEAFYGYYATPRSGWFVLGIGIVACGGDAQFAVLVSGPWKRPLFTWQVERAP